MKRGELSVGKVHDCSVDPEPEKIGLEKSDK